MMTQAEREAAYTRIRSELGVDRIGTSPDAPQLPPRQTSRGDRRASAALPIEGEIAGALMIEYGEIWARPGLDLRTRSFATVAALQALGHDEQLYRHVNIALNVGITPDEIHETFLHGSVYAGIPTLENAASVATEVFVARGLIEPGDGLPVEPKAPMDDQDRKMAMHRVFAALGVGRRGLDPDAPALACLPGPLSKIVGTRIPVEYDLAMIGAEFGYGEVWGRPGLDLRTRSFITMSLLQVMHENDQLHLHINNAVNLGITPDEIHEVLAHVGMYGGVSGWHNASNVAKHVLAQWGVGSH